MRRTFSHATYYYLLYGAALLATLALCWFVAVSGHTLRQLAVRDYNLYHCDFIANPGGPVLRILDAIYMEDLGVMSTWCKFSQLGRHYGSLEARSVHRDHLNLRELYESHYDLVAAKPELIDGGSPAGKGSIGYELIAKYPDYGSQLVSLQGTPELTEAWMTGKTLGLLDDPNSVSAYQIPKAALRNVGLEDVPEIIYFRSYRQLYKALFEGTVDIIPALVSDEGPASSLKLPPGLILKEIIPGPGWYISGELLDTPAHCDLLEALKALAAGTARVDYFRNLRAVRDCNAI